MDQTFMTIHNLSPDANILFASDSISDILGYQPDEVRGRPAFSYFHPEEVPFARSVHSRGVLLDKAAVLHYARILAKDGRWVSCECCFTIVHDVLVACTSIYKRGEKSERRAIEAPQIRRIFSSSPRDPRYNMLEHLSPKFKMPPMEREPRAALILNRFTRTVTVMFATNAITQLLGLHPEEIKDRSFYECIAENCLNDAIQCLESAKANDSIAYLRFWYRDPRQTENAEDEDGERASMRSRSSSDDGADPDGDMDIDELDIKEENVEYSGISSQFGSISHQFDRATNRIQSPNTAPRRRGGSGSASSFELEAVVSCTSDGLVVVLRRARPPIPPPHPPLLSPFDFENGLFAAPWGQQPIRPYYPPEMLYTFRPPLLPQFMPLRESVKAAGGPPLDQLMRSIQDVAVFAWALVGINGNLAAFARGLPTGDAQPHDGLPVWNSKAGMEACNSLTTNSEASHSRWEPVERGKMSSGSSTATGPFRPALHYATDPPNLAPQRQQNLPRASSSSINGNVHHRGLFSNRQNWPLDTNPFGSSAGIPSSSPFDHPPTASNDQTPRAFDQNSERWPELSLSYSPSSNYPMSTAPPSSPNKTTTNSFRPWQ